MRVKMYLLVILLLLGLDTGVAQTKRGNKMNLIESVGT